MVTAETSVYKIEWIECCSMRTQSGITQDKKHELLHRNFITADLFRMASAELATLIRYIIYHNNALEYLIIFQLIMCGLFSSFNFQICLLSSVAFFLFLLQKEWAWWDNVLNVFSDRRRFLLPSLWCLPRCISHQCYAMEKQ